MGVRLAVYERLPSKKNLINLYEFLKPQASAHLWTVICPHAQLHRYIYVPLCQALRCFHKDFGDILLNELDLKLRFFSISQLSEEQSIGLGHKFQIWNSPNQYWYQLFGLLLSFHGPFTRNNNQAQKAMLKDNFGADRAGCDTATTA